MKYKTAIIYGIILWCLITLVSTILPSYILNWNFATILFPLSLILLTSFFTIIYIRNYNSNELIESLKLSIIFSIIYVVGDFLLLLFKSNYINFEIYPTNLISIIVLIIITTTFIGYLAQMPIELR